MRRVRLILLPCLMFLLMSGCDEAGSNRRKTLLELRRANQEQQRQIEAQSKVMFGMGLVLVMLGGGLALMIGVLNNRKGGVSSNPIHDHRNDR